MTPQIFAAIYITAHKFREDSWVENKRVYPATPTMPFSVTSPGSYKKSYDEAALEAVRFHKQDERWAEPIKILMVAGFSDIEDWARSLI